MPHQFEPIGIIRSCFKEKFGIPRQGILIPESRGRIEFLPPFDQADAFRGIDAYSHLWIVFVFHANPAGKFKATVRPPRLGGNQRIGVFATRSGFRPNPIGLSLVKLKGVGRKNGRQCLNIEGIDLLDGTPVLDIKPYLPWADTPHDAMAGFATQPPPQKIDVSFSSQAEDFLNSLPPYNRKHIQTLITQMLRNDPRPAIDQNRYRSKEYGACLYDWNIRWEVNETCMRVIDITPIADTEASLTKHPPSGQTGSASK